MHLSSASKLCHILVVCSHGLAAALPLSIQNPQMNPLSRSSFHQLVGGTETIGDSQISPVGQGCTVIATRYQIGHHSAVGGFDKAVKAQSSRKQRGVDVLHVNSSHPRIQVGYRKAREGDGETQDGWVSTSCIRESMRPSSAYYDGETKQDGNVEADGDRRMLSITIDPQMRIWLADI